MKKIAEEYFDKASKYIVEDTQWLTRGKIEYIERILKKTREEISRIYDTEETGNNG